MKLFNYIALRLVFVAAVFTLAALVYEQWFYPRDLVSEGWLQLKLGKLEVQKDDVLYLGASCNKSFDIAEPDHRTIVEMIGEKDPELPIVSFDTGAMHVGILTRVLQWIDPENLPRTVVCEMHLRSFSADWLESDLENSLQRNLVYTNRAIPLWNRIRVALKDYPWVPPAERKRRISNHFRFDYLPYNDYRRTIFHWFRELEKRCSGPPAMAGEYVKKFAFRIKENGQRLKQYDEMLAFCREKNIRLIFVVYGENVEEIERLVGKELVDIMQRNVQFLVNRYTTADSEVINCWNKIPDNAWYERDFVTEHYRANGRRIIAESIVKQLQWKSGKHRN